MVVRVKQLRKHIQIIFLKLIQRIDLPEDFYMLFLAAIIGIMTGIGACVLHLFINGFHPIFFKKSLVFSPFPGSSSLFLILFPAIGGLIVGWVIHYFSRESRGHGVPAVIEALANHDGYIRPRVTLITSFPAVTATPGAYALVGMGIMIAGTNHATISALMLIFEITYNYQIILPLMLGMIIAIITCRMIMQGNIYTMEIALSSEYIFKGRNKTLLQSIPIQQHVQAKFESLTENLPFGKILDLLRHSNHAVFPVLELDKKLVGLVSLQNIRSYMFDKELYPRLIAKDIIQEEFISVHSAQSLAEVFRLFDLTDAELIPVTEKKKKEHLLGVIYRDDLMCWYRKAPLLQYIR